MPATPVETLKAYTIAVKRKDVEMMKMLLSEASLGIHREQAKAQNVSIDEIIKRETIFSETQRIFDYRNEKIEGNKATVEVKNDFGGWDIVHLLKEKGIWKIDKKGFSDQIIDQNQEAERKLNEQIERERQQAEQNANADVNSNGETPQLDSNGNLNQKSNSSEPNQPVTLDSNKPPKTNN